MAVFPRSTRTFAFLALELSGLGKLLRRKGPRLLLYHGATSGGSGGIFNYRQKFIPTEAFRMQMKWLKTNYRILPLAEFIERHAQGLLPEHALAITFDDGYANNYSDAYPTLKALGVPATFFITTGFIEGAPMPVDRVEYAVGHSRAQTISLPWEEGERVFALSSRKERIAADLCIRSYMKTLPHPEEFLMELEARAGVRLADVFATSPYRPLSWDEMREMEENGMTFAPHTRTHAILSRIPAERAHEEIASSRNALVEKLAHPLSHVFAYPNGGAHDFTEETISILKELEFVAALTTKPRTTGTKDDPFRLPRYTMDGSSSLPRARLTASGAYTRLRTLFS